jgi:hypothetical protein
MYEPLEGCAVIKQAIMIRRPGEEAAINDKSNGKDGILLTKLESYVIQEDFLDEGDLV